ncbi:MAG TPA: RidA family protein [Bryobacteraceae bacterium]|nr:RidA family protein [Bryobacteraceae bacterium]
MKHFALIPCLAIVVALIAAPSDKKKHQEPVTQALQLPPELPAVIVADADRLVYQVTPLRGDGLLSQQLREALRVLLRQDRPLIKLRAFVAGTGDTRRVQAVVSELATERHLSLPVLTVVQVGQLPRDGAQVVLEAVASDRKAVNPNGLVMVPAESDSANQPLQPVLPHLRRVLEHLRTSLASNGAGPDEALQVTCYPTSLDEMDQFRTALTAVFPKAVFEFVQPRRATLDSGVSCEAVARLVAPQPSGAGRLVFTSAQLAFGDTPADARLAFERLGKTLAQAGASYNQVVHLCVYSLSRATAEVAVRAGREFFDPARPPALTVVPVEGLPSLDASFAVDAEAVLPVTR